MARRSKKKDAYAKGPHVKERPKKVRLSDGSTAIIRDRVLADGTRVRLVVANPSKRRGK